MALNYTQLVAAECTWELISHDLHHLLEGNHLQHTDEHT